MSELGQVARLEEPVIGAFVLHIYAPERLIIKCPDKVEGQRLLQIIHKVYGQGKRNARREVREALGLDNWGRTVSCTDI